MVDLQYPRGEIIWAEYYSRAGQLLFIVTSKESRDWYTLYELVDGVFKKLDRAKEPPELERKYKVLERMRA